MISLDSKKRNYVNANKIRELIISEAESIRNLF